MLADRDVLLKMDKEAACRRARIGGMPDATSVCGISYYVSADGNDASDGKSPNTAWRTTARASAAALSFGDRVLFRRGDLFRGQVICQSGVTYAAFGEGEKPRFYSHDGDLADPALWELYDEKSNIWRLVSPILDVGTLYFNGGCEVAYKHIPSYTREGRFVVRDEPARAFVITRELSY